MKLLVFSDSHGRTLEMHDAMNREKPDAVVHLGDCTDDARELRRAYQTLPICFVRGNNDFDYEVPFSRVVTYAGVKVYVTHGHRERVSMGGIGLVGAEAAASGCQLALFGHTHRVFLEQQNGLWIFNPGSISLPRGGRPGYGRISIANGDIMIEPITITG